MTKVVIYSKAVCPYCDYAKEFFDQQKIAYEEIKVDQDAKALAYMMEASGRRTVPQIFIQDQPIGGYDDLMALHRDGQLDQLLTGE